MRVDFEQKLEYLQFAEQSLKVHFPQASCTWLTSLDEAGSILGVVVYERCTQYNCEMSVAAASPLFLNRRALRVFFRYPFTQLNLRRVTAMVSVQNTHAYQFNRRLGFSVEGCARRWYGDADGILLGMLKEECKWL